MFIPLQVLPKEELDLRKKRLFHMLALYAPEAGGILIFNRVSIYHLSGTLASGVLWIPLTGEPVLLCRRAMERAKLESRLSRIVEFRSYRDIAPLLKEAGSPLSDTIAVQAGGLPWDMGQKLTAALPSAIKMVPGDMALAMTRAKKTPWELDILRKAGTLHHKALYTLLPKKIAPGMTEQEIAHRLWEIFFAHGHGGILRMGNFGEECFLGHIAAGDSANYPSAYNGPVGLKGTHPAIPFMGSAEKIWQKNEPLVCDTGFCLDGYITDKTQVYWSGSEKSIPQKVLKAHGFCKEIQHWLAEHLVPGTHFEELYIQVMEMAKARGMEDGFMSLGKNKVRFLGHGTGLVIDEFPVIAEKIKIPVEEGMVLALEPKFGISNIGMTGVENTFEVTATGAKPITGENFGIVYI